MDAFRLSHYVFPELYGGKFRASLWQFVEEDLDVLGRLRIWENRSRESGLKSEVFLEMEEASNFNSFLFELEFR